MVVLGPTASGKTALAVRLAQELNGEIISADSRQVYRDMDIGTGKDLTEYGSVPYHLIDIVEAGEQYHLFQFQQDCYEAIRLIRDKGKLPILCGGSGLYIEAVLNKYTYTGVPINEPLRQSLQAKEDRELLEIFKLNPQAFSEKADVSSRKRLIRAIEINDYLSKNEFTEMVAPDFEVVIIGLNPDTETRRKRITTRLNQRLDAGMIAEVQTLLERGVPPEKLIFYGLEYKFIVEYLQNKYDYATMVARLEVAIHQFAKRQMTFFRGMERDGWYIDWKTSSQ